MRLTDGCDADNFGGNVDKPRKKRVKKSTLKNSEPPGREEVEASGGENASKKKRSPKRGKRKSGYAQTSDLSFFWCSLHFELLN